MSGTAGVVRPPATKPPLPAPEPADAPDHYRLRKRARPRPIIEFLEERCLLTTVPPIEARAVTSSIQVDGRLDEPAWSTADTVQNFYILNSNGQIALSTTTVKFLRNDQPAH